MSSAVVGVRGRPVGLRVRVQPQVGERVEVAALQRFVEGGVGELDLLDVGLGGGHRSPPAAPVTARATRTASARRPHLVHADRPGALVGGDGGDRGGGGVALAGGRRGALGAREDPAEEPLAGGGDQDRVAQLAQPVEAGEERQVVLGVLGEAEARVDDDALGGDAALDGGRPRARGSSSTTSETTSS